MEVIMNVKEVKETFENVGKIYGFTKKQVALLNSAKDEEILKSCFRMLINGFSDGVVSEIIAKSENADVCNSLANKKMAEKYANYDETMKACDEVSKQAEKISGYNSELVKAFEEDVKTAIERERAAMDAERNRCNDVIASLKDNIANQAKAMSMWEERYKEQKSLYEKLEKEKMTLQVACAALESEKAKADRYAGAQVSSPVAETPSSTAEASASVFQTISDYSIPETTQESKKSILGFLKNKNDPDSEAKIKYFVENVLSNDKYSSEQVNYLVKSIVEGTSLKTFVLLCDPKVDVEIMDVLRHYNERNK